jgi:hypothetical protein
MAQAMRPYGIGGNNGGIHMPSVKINLLMALHFGFRISVTVPFQGT